MEYKEIMPRLFQVKWTNILDESKMDASFPTNVNVWTLSQSRY